MIKHIIMFRFHDPKWKDENLQKVAQLIVDLKKSIPSLMHIEAGINISQRDVAYDIVLVSDFKTEDDLEAYRSHPEHIKLIEFLRTTEYDRTVVDYKY
jgi:Stress responsive A/B Barrel Domain